MLLVTLTKERLGIDEPKLCFLLHHLKKGVKKRETGAGIATD